MQTHISTGWSEIPICCAATTEIGMMISEVAVFEITCPRIADRTNSPASSA